MGFIIPARQKILGRGTTSSQDMPLPVLRYHHMPLCQADFSFNIALW